MFHVPLAEKRRPLHFPRPARPQPGLRLGPSPRAQFRLISGTPTRLYCNGLAQPARPFWRTARRRYAGACCCHAVVQVPSHPTGNERVDSKLMGRCDLLQKAVKMDADSGLDPLSLCY